MNGSCFINDNHVNRKLYRVCCVRKSVPASIGLSKTLFGCPENLKEQKVMNKDR